MAERDCGEGGGLRNSDILDVSSVTDAEISQTAATLVQFRVNEEYYPHRPQRLHVHEIEVGDDVQ